jgi:hypothetical protein
MATVPEIRIYSGKPTAEGVSFPRKDFLRIDYSACDRMECNNGRQVEATWTKPGPVVFGKWPRKCVMPFADRTYPTFDELADDMRSAGLAVIDHRRTVGVVGSIEQFEELMETHILERFGNETIFIRRYPDGTHDDIWQLTDRAFNAVSRKLVTVDKNNRRQTFTRGKTPFAGLSEWQRQSITRAFQPIVVLTAPLPCAPLAEKRSYEPTEAEKEAIMEMMPKLPKPGRVDTSPIFAYDDQGRPITELDLVKESTRKLPKGMPKSLVPSVSENCSDEKWEKLILAEQIKFRRRTEPT